MRDEPDPPESVSHPLSQTKGPGSLDLIELKLCSREIVNFWNLYFNGISLGDPVLSSGTKAGFWKSSLEQWTCCLSQLVWGPAHSQSCHEAVCKSVVPEKDRTGSITTSHRNRLVLQQQGPWDASPGLLVILITMQTFFLSIASPPQNLCFCLTHKYGVNFMFGFF